MTQEYCIEAGNPVCTDRDSLYNVTSCPDKLLMERADHRGMVQHYGGHIGPDGQVASPLQLKDVALSGDDMLPCRQPLQQTYRQTTGSRMLLGDKRMA